MSVLTKYRTPVALFLVLILLNPLMVKSFHHHENEHNDCCHNTPPSGLNPSVGHHHLCKICSFEYVNVLLEEIPEQSKPASHFCPCPTQPTNSKSTSPLPYALLRAPPFTLWLPKDYPGFNLQKG